jgi:demethylmenaquinone methyltransferase / 2-methoxy-6-polyprenyl-1,4-benzoquinol methylase
MVEIPYSPKDPGSIQLLFTRIARNYDATNHVISLGFDVLWRKRFARLFRDRTNIADVCCGSGAMIPVLGNKIRVGLDFTRAMLSVCAERNPKSRLVEGDAQNIPFATGSFDGAMIVYSIRNIPDTRKALTELHRILQPGGLLGILDFGVPRRKLLESVYLFYFRRIMPFIGSYVARDKSSYHYFVNSVIHFPKREEFVKLMEEAGFQNCTYQEYTLGAALCYLGKK